MGRKPQDPLLRFWEKVDKSGDCWLWTAHVAGSNGYGQFAITHIRMTMAHRFSYELHYGAIPDGLKVLHSCDTPRCVRPDHLFLGTNADNTADMFAKGRAATGDRHWTRLHPERLVFMRGDNNPMRRYPEKRPAGERCGRAKLTWAIVRAIRSRWERGDVFQRELAASYSVDQTLISLIIRGKIWREGGNETPS